MADDKKEYPLIKMAGGNFKSRLKKIKPFISNEEARFNLNGVLLQYENQVLRMVATNGHILCEQTFDVETELSQDYDPFEVIMPRTAVENLIKIMPSKKESMFTMQVIDEGKNIRFDFFESEYITATIDANFPDYKAVMPKGDVTVQFGLNAGYLINALVALNNEAVNINIDKTDEPHKTPHLLTSDGAAGIKCVIMPQAAFGA